MLSLRARSVLLASVVLLGACSWIDDAVDPDPSELESAVIQGDLGRTVELVEAGEDVNDSLLGRSVLTEAIRGGNAEVVEFLVANGAKVHGDDRDGAG